MQAVHIMHIEREVFKDFGLVGAEQSGRDFDDY
jgi:hypothetical protein